MVKLKENMFNGSTPYTILPFVKVETRQETIMFSVLGKTLIICLKHLRTFVRHSEPKSHKKMEVSISSPKIHNLLFA